MRARISFLASVSTVSRSRLSRMSSWALRFIPALTPATPLLGVIVPVPVAMPAEPSGVFVPAVMVAGIIMALFCIKPMVPMPGGNAIPIPAIAAMPGIPAWGRAEKLFSPIPNPFGKAMALLAMVLLRLLLLVVGAAVLSFNFCFLLVVLLMLAIRYLWAKS